MRLAVLLRRIDAIGRRSAELRPIRADGENRRHSESEDDPSIQHP
jgi:hypothetical protein